MVLKGMKLARSRITAQGQISVPAEVRRRLAVGPGSVLEWDATGDTIAIRRVGRFSSADLHAVLFPRPPAARTLRELDEGIRQHVRQRHARR